MSEIIWCAEIGSMHKGDKSLAFEMIRQAKEANADIVKFQFGWTREAQLAQGHEYKAIRYVDEWADDLADWCKHFNIELMASLWSLEGLETARRVNMRRYKIAHQMKDQALIDAIIGDGKPVFWSGHIGAKHAIWVSQKYPTYPSDLEGMPSQFFEGHYFGYSDHSHGIEACLLAVARGARYIEKHFCLDKTDLATRDTPFSADPREFAEMVRIGNGIERILSVQV